MDARRALWLCALAAFSATPIFAATLATVRGRVTAEPGVEKKAPGSAGAYAQRALSYAPFFDYKHLKNVVIYAEEAGAPAAEPPAGERAVASLTIKKNRYGVSFEPDFAAVPLGSDLKIDNPTGDSVNVYEGGAPKERFFVDIPAKSAKTVRLKNTRLYNLFCLEDANCRARVLVAGPYVTPVKPDGSYELKLPAGRYTLTAWHDRFPPQTQPLEITDGQEATMNFLLSIKNLPEIK